VLPQTHKIDVIGDISNCQITPSVSVNVQDGASQNISIQCFITSRFGNRIIGKDMTDFSCHTTYGDNDCGTLGQNEANWSRTYSPVSDDITITITNGSELAPEDSGEVVSGGSIVGNSAVILNDSKSNTGVRPVFSNLLTENLPAIANRSVVAKPIFGAAVLADKFFDRGLNLFNLASSLIQNVSQTIIDAFQNIII
jgi:hypothetical protein